jgi:NosR/NirI family transcriptional regulator, nitrous oxide reductase regulator
MSNLASASSHLSIFWLILSLFQTFFIIPVIVLFWGKGAYCGWICSCGALAETLGNDYRKKALHGTTAKHLENIGQIILLFAIIVTLLSLSSLLLPSAGPPSRFLVKTYSLAVDTVFAGVAGLGFYFFLTGRVWCRFFCPLAALMHIFTRFSRFRIMSNKNRCISCNICTHVCHMGIDVLNYANKGIPMNDVQCVRCSACVTSCPLQVLTFGKVRAFDVDNQSHKTSSHALAKGWTSGLSEDKIRMLLKEQEQNAR